MKLNIDTITSRIGPYTGCLAREFNDKKIFDQLADLPRLLESKDVTRLSNGNDYVVKLDIDTKEGHIPITVKVFKRQGILKDWYDFKNKSKAERSFNAAIYLQNNQIGTPAPIAWIDRWEGKKLIESYYLSLYEPAVCFRDALADIYYNSRDNGLLMDLLNAVAPAIRAMHDAGFMHGDMGNQNILIPKDSNGKWLAPQLIDLNRCAIRNSALGFDERAFDLSRIALPGAYLKIFKTIYCHHEEIPKDLDGQELHYRRRFEWHQRSRKWRRPLRYLKARHNKPANPTYPPPQDIWLWDEKSAQPMIVLGRKEKNRYRDWSYMLSMAWQSFISAPVIFMRYRKLISKSYQQPISMTGRIGIALNPKADYIPTELALLKTLGNPPVLIRFYHHEGTDDWMRAIELIDSLHRQGVEIMATFLQDRQAVLQPDKWTFFLETVICAIADKVAHIEITHASNRVKWGIWNAHEYRSLMEPAFALQKRYPRLKLTGPACIDFEYHPVIAALRTTPHGYKFSALSHLLYVDRRGAPENKQGRFSTLEKCALLKALAQWSDHCENKVIISEVNWPVKYTGIWSPIGCPYETPKWRRDEPGETEEDYANYMLRYLIITLCSGHVEQVFWWRLSAHGYGLVDDLNNFRPRPAFTALAFFLKTLGQANFVCKHPSQEGFYSFEFHTSDMKIVVAWCEDKSLSKIMPVNFTHAFDREGNIMTAASVSESPIYLLSEH